LLAEVTRIEEEEQDISCGIDDIEITSPISGDEVGGELPIQREIIDADNCEDLNLDIMLRDHNEQWIRI
jgi:hypothetical protein